MSNLESLALTKAEIFTFKQTGSASDPEKEFIYIYRLPASYKHLQKISLTFFVNFQWSFDIIEHSDY